MNKEEFIEKYGKGTYDEMLRQARRRSKEWRKTHPEKAIATNQEISRKGGKYYEKMREYNLTGLPHERGLVRKRHQKRYSPYKQVIAPDSQIHHEWVANSADYTGVALVEKDQHLHGFVDVIRILDGEITLLTEEEIVGRKR